MSALTQFYCKSHSRAYRVWLGGTQVHLHVPAVITGNYTSAHIKSSLLLWPGKKYGGKEPVYQVPK